MDTPEKLTSTIMWTLCLVRNSISIDLHTIRTQPEMWPPCYSVKQTLGHRKGKYSCNQVTVNSHQQRPIAAGNYCLLKISGLSYIKAKLVL